MLVFVSGKRMRHLMSSPSQFRLLIWEREEHADALARFCETTGRPFFFRKVAEVAEFRGLDLSQERGRLFEFNSCPVDVQGLVEVVNRTETQSSVQSDFYFSSPPVLVCRRKQGPADPLRPFLEFLPILDQVSSDNSHGRKPARDDPA